MTQYVGSGGLKLGGCAYASYTPNYARPFAVGDKLFIRRLAVKGHLEFVYIKRIDQVTESEAVYVDTLNWRHREGDLCTEVEALTLAIAWYESYTAMLRDRVGCHPDTSVP